MTDETTARQCEVPGCANTAGPGLRVCGRHLREPATPKDHSEALAYLRHRLARYDQFRIQPDRADSLELHGSYDIAALRLVLEGPQGSVQASLERPAGYKPTIIQRHLSRETLPEIARALAKGELAFQGFQIPSKAGDTKPITISEAELLAPTEALYAKLEEHAGVMGQFWVREDQS